MTNFDFDRIYFYRGQNNIRAKKGNRLWWNARLSGTVRQTTGTDGKKELALSLDFLAPWRLQ
jgi:hypothetical protein